MRDQYDVILLDCCPSLGVLTINALAAADEVLIPVQAHYLPMKGLEQLIRTIVKVRRRINPQLLIEGILITMADLRTNFARDIVELLHSTYDGTLRIFDSVIPLSVRAAESTAECKSVYIYDPAGKVANTEALDRLLDSGAISTRGLKQDAKVVDEMVFDVNSAYFERGGGYDYAKHFFEHAYKLAVKEAGGEEYSTARRRGRRKP